MTGISKTQKAHRKLLFPVLLAVVTALFAAAMLPSEPVWITDNGNKLMIMHNFMENGTIFFDHPSPVNFPFGGFHFQKLADGRISSFHSPYLPVLTALVCKITGSIGVLLIPIISLALIMAVIMEFPGRKHRIFAAIAATPLLFYSLLLWEMVPAALAVTLSCRLLYRRRYILAGAVFAGGLWMREELFLLGACLLVILLFQKRWRLILRFGMGAIIPTAGLWLTNFLLFGNIFGIHGSTYFINNRPEISILMKCREVIFNFYQHLLRFDTLGKYSFFLALAAVIPLVIAGFAPEYRKWRKFKVIAGTVFTLLALCFAAALWRHRQFLLISAATFGLFISVPVLAGFLLNLRPLLCDRNRLIAAASRVFLLYTLVIAFFLNSFDIGLTWGARHFIMLLPVMVYLSVYGLLRAGFFTFSAGKAIFAGCVCAGVIMQLYAIAALVKVTADAESLQMKILAMPPETVVSDLFFLPEMTPQVPFAKTQLEISSAGQLDAALEYLDKNNITEFILILSPDYRHISNEDLQKLLRRYPPVIRPEKSNVGNSLDFLVTLCRKIP